MPRAPRQPREGPVPPDLLLRYLVVLADTDPLVWRRIVVPASYTFWSLHVAIQDAMGWLDYHLHEFRVVDPRSGTLLAAYGENMGGNGGFMAVFPRMWPRWSGPGVGSCHFGGAQLGVDLAGGRGR